MKISNDEKTLLDKLYNLRGEDSVILAKMNKEREEAIETGERTKNEKEVLLNKIDKLTKEEETLQEEGNKLTSILSNINRDDFANVLDRLQIDFDPASINEKITNKENNTPIIINFVLKLSFPQIFFVKLLLSLLPKKFEEKS